MNGMNIIVRRIAQLMVPSIFLLGIYIVLQGHLTPGGGFAGGVMIAGGYILYVLAFGLKDQEIVNKKNLASLAESLGIFLFWSLSILGLILGSVFFYNVIAKVNPGQRFHLFSGGIIPLCNIVIGIEVAAALFAVFILLVSWEGKEGRR